MSIRWERFAGDTSTFAVKLAFHNDPDAGESSTPEMAESWGAIRIWARGKNLCAHVDQGETLESVHWYLLPMLEWLSTNWDPLLHEERPPEGMRSIRTATDVSGIAADMTRLVHYGADQVDSFGRQYEWRLRHALQAARDGGIFPDMRLRRVREQIEISWSDSRLAGVEGVEFLSSSGTEYLDPDAVAGPLYEVLESAADWLRAKLPESKRCSELAESVRTLKSPQRNAERTAWIAGLGSNWDRMKERWTSISALAQGSPGQDASGAIDAVFGTQGSNGVVLGGSCAAALLFGSTNPAIGEADAQSLAKRLVAAYDASPVDGLADLVLDEPIRHGHEPWKHGYELAEELLDEIGDDLEGPSVDIEAFLNDRNVRISEINLADEELRAVSFVGDKHAPSIMLNRHHRSAERPSAQRFTLAHELCHLLHDRSHGTRLAIASGPWAPLAIE